MPNLQTDLFVGWSDTAVSVLRKKSKMIWWHVVRHFSHSLLLTVKDVCTRGSGIFTTLSLFMGLLMTSSFYLHIWSMYVCVCLLMIDTSKPIKKEMTLKLLEDMDNCSIFNIHKLIYITIYIYIYITAWCDNLMFQGQECKLHDHETCQIDLPACWSKLPEGSVHTWY